MLEKLEIFNRNLFMLINGGEHTSSGVLSMAVALGDTSIFLVPLALLWMWFRGDTAQRNRALKVCTVILVALGINQVIGLLWQHPRPFVVGLGHLWIPHQPDSSFPSDHVTVLSAFGLTLLASGAVVFGGMMVGLALVVSFARVFLGVHFPLDMVGAFAVSSVCLVAATPLWKQIGARVTSALEWVYRRVCAWPIRKDVFRY